MQISVASTSPSLSLSSLSSTSSDDMIELKPKDAKSNLDQQNRNHSNFSSGLGELHSSRDDNTPRSVVSVVTNASVRPAPLSPTPTQSPPVQVMDREAYDPQRIPLSIFEKSGALDWSLASNESLFSIKLGDNSLARDHGIDQATDIDTSLARDQVFRYNDFLPEELQKSGELLTYRPSLPIHLGDSERKISDAEEQSSGETGTTAETDCEEKSSIPILSWRDFSQSSDLTFNGYINSGQLPASLQSFSSPISKKSKRKSKTKTTITTKNTKKKKCSLSCCCCCFSCGNCCKNAWACRCCCRCSTCCGGFSCLSCCSCLRCCCCCYSSSSLEITHGDGIGTEKKSKGHGTYEKGCHKWLCYFPLCSWCCCFCCS